MNVRVYTDYEPVRILRGISKKDFTEPTDALALKCGLVGNFVEVDETEIPSDRSYRGAWKVEDGKIKTDSVKVQKIDEDFSKKEADVLIAEKLTELAIAELKKEGKLDISGKITLLGKSDLAGGV